ncbi:MAG: hypothetical protein U0163_14215 [Gemmatimonadaceae bacterium]
MAEIAPVKTPSRAFDTRLLPWAVLSACLLAAACSSSDTSTNPKVSLVRNPCTGGDAVTIPALQATRIDCGNGGTTVTLTGSGASYLIVPEFATGTGSNSLVSYRMFTGTAASASLVASSRLGAASLASTVGSNAGLLPPYRPNRAQMELDQQLLRRAHAQLLSSGRRGVIAASRSIEPSAAIVPAVGSVRQFHVLSNFNSGAFKNVGARLAFAGSNVLVYVDTLSPPGFTDTQLQQFGQYVDGTLYGIATSAFGTPSDVDQNGHIIMLMSPVVNADSPAANCATQGFVAGFFMSNDFNGPSDPISNQGEIFYSIVPDPGATVSCAHTVESLGLDIPATFLHELQHLINYSQHVVINGGNDGSSWLDEGLSIVAEELGSQYWETKCPPPACRTNAAQLFPDSAQGFVQSFLYDSYQYALLPDTASITLHTDSDGGFAWRGGTWLLARYLGDQLGATAFRQLERGPSDGITAIEQAAGRSFPSVFADFGLALYTDSLPGLPRNSAPTVNRFTTRNPKQLWARLFVTSAGSDVPRADPLQLFPITADSSTSVMVPGTTTYFQLDTPTNASTVTIEFSAPGGAAFSSALHPQIAVFRLK